MNRTVLIIGNENTELIQELGVEREKNGMVEGRETKRQKRDDSAGLVHCLTEREKFTFKASFITFVKVRHQNGMIKVSPVEDDTCQSINALYQETDRIAIINLREGHGRQTHQYRGCGVNI